MNAIWVIGAAAGVLLGAVANVALGWSPGRYAGAIAAKGKSWLYDPRFVDKIPILTTLMLEGANLSQIRTMWVEKTAEGQSLSGWLMVNLALLLWLHLYRVRTPELKWAIRATAFGIVMNFFVILSVVYFRYFG